MSRALVPGLRILKQTQILKRRELPILGRVLVNVGDRVTADTHIAEADVPGELFILRLPERMGIETFEVMGGLKVKEGDSVTKGQILCEHAGLFGLLKTRFSSPESGVIEFVAPKTAHLGLRLPSEPIHVQSYIAGTVKEIIENKGVLVAAEGAAMQGIFGVGGERTGKLSMLNISDDKEVLASDIPDDISKNIIAGGARFSLEAIELAVKKGAIGIITGSIDDAVLAEYLGYELGIALTGDEDIPMTLIVTEGFGKLSLSSKISSLLKEHHGKEISINGATQVRAGAVRPEILIPVESEKTNIPQTEDASGLEVGKEIRLIRVPYFGKKAVVTELPTNEEQIETGAMTRVLRAKLLGEDLVVTVPRANVELSS